MTHGPLIFDSRLDAFKRWICVRVNHRGGGTQRRLRGVITCGRCYLVIGHWR